MTSATLINRSLINEKPNTEDNDPVAYSLCIKCSRSCIHDGETDGHYNYVCDCNEGVLTVMRDACGDCILTKDYCSCGAVVCSHCDSPVYHAVDHTNLSRFVCCCILLFADEGNRPVTASSTKDKKEDHNDSVSVKRMSCSGLHCPLYYFVKAEDNTLSEFPCPKTSCSGIVSENGYKTIASPIRLHCRQCKKDAFVEKNDATIPRCLFCDQHFYTTKSLDVSLPYQIKTSGGEKIVSLVVNPKNVKKDLRKAKVEVKKLMGYIEYFDKMGAYKTQMEMSSMTSALNYNKYKASCPSEDSEDDEVDPTEPMKAQRNGEEVSPAQPLDEGELNKTLEG